MKLRDRKKMKKIACTQVVEKSGIIALLLEGNSIYLKVASPVKISKFGEIIESITLKNPSIFNDDIHKIYPAPNLSEEELKLYKKVISERGIKNEI